jgi:hypothetical protein
LAATLFVCLTPASLCSSIESGFLYGAQVAELSAESVFCASVGDDFVRLPADLCAKVPLCGHTLSAVRVFLVVAVCLRVVSSPK